MQLQKLIEDYVIHNFLLAIFIKDDIENIAYLPWYGVQPEEDEYCYSYFWKFWILW